MENTTEWNDGYNAYLDDLNVCPYPEGSEQARSWLSGWYYAQDQYWEAQTYAWQEMH